MWVRSMFGSARGRQEGQQRNSWVVRCRRHLLLLVGKESYVSSRVRDRSSRWFSSRIVAKTRSSAGNTF